ncbi:MAG: hypothetical protein QN134_09270 [Armatimonadota bacterium]|nr:hypothetical protein [Armatimonadota bacterium]
MRRDPGALFAAVAGTAALALAALDLARHRAFWSPDSGLRFLQVEALVRQGYRRVSIPYPGARFDPGARYLPFGDWFLVRRGGQLCVVYPPYFPALASLPYRALGFAGLLVLPLAGAVAVLRIIAHLQKASEPPWPALAVLAVLSTPLAVYGLLFWDHAPAAGLGAGAAALVTAAGWQKRDAPAFLSGLLAGLGLWLRTEMYLFTVALMLAAWRVFGRRVAAWVAVGALVPALAVWTLNLHLFGHPLGLKGEAAVGARVAEVRSAAQAVEGWAKRRLLVAYDLLISTEQPQNGEQPERIGPSLAVSGAVVAGSALLTWGAWSRDVARILVGAGVAVLGPVYAAVTGQHLMGLLPTMPFVAALPLAVGNPSPEVRYPLLVGPCTSRRCSPRPAWAVSSGALGTCSPRSRLSCGPRWLPSLR